MKTELVFPKNNRTLTEFNEIQQALKQYQVEFTRWSAQVELNSHSTQDEILQAYEHELNPYMKKHGYLSADVINVHAQTPDIEIIRKKFLQEHTHSENEIRFFVDGAGVFWFHFDDGEIAKLTCVKGDFLSVPQNYKHWFDLAPYYAVKAIRIFTSKDGWVAHYTQSKVEEMYL